MSDDLDAVEAMLASSPGLATRQGHQSPVLLAAYRHRADILQALLSRHPPLDIFEASAVGNLDAIRASVQRAPRDIHGYSADGFTPLHLAAFFGHEAAVRLLLDCGARVDAITRNDLENTPLHAAAAGGHYDVCAVLIQRATPVNARQEGGFTALHAAAQQGNMPLARLLLANGADVSIETDEGKTAADTAYEFEHDEIASYLRPDAA